MKKLAYIATFVAAITMFLSSCNNAGNGGNAGGNDSISADSEVVDTTVYGRCGEGSAMNSVELITDAGDTLRYILLDSEDNPADVQGGLLTGDRLAVIGQEINGELIATRVINLTTLIGKWTSLDKNFEILEGGEVKSNVKTESQPWVAWKILNGQLLLNTDTFTINELGADSLYLENNAGIFVYKRAE